MMSYVKGKTETSLHLRFFITPGGLFKFSSVPVQPYFNHFLPHFKKVARHPFAVSGLRGDSYLHPLIHNPDGGSQYASEEFQNLLREHAVQCSMSGKGNCYDNAVVKSFFGTLKKELIYFEDYKTRDEAKRSIFEYIEIFYNRKRRHSSLGYKSPVEFEKLKMVV